MGPGWGWKRTSRVRRSHLVLRRRGRFVYAANALTDVASQILSAQLIQRRGGLHPIVAHGAQWHQRFAQLVELFLQDQGDTAAGKARAPMRSKYSSTVHDRSARGLMAADVNHEGGDSADGDGSEFWTLGDAQRWDTHCTHQAGVRRSPRLWGQSALGG